MFFSSFENTVAKLGREVEKLASTKLCLLEKSREYRQMKLDYKTESDFFQKSNLPSLVAKAVEEKWTNFQKTYFKDAQILGKAQTKFQKEVDRLLRKSPELKPLTLYSRFLTEEQFVEISTNLVKGHKQGMLPDSTLKASLQKLKKFKKIESLEKPVYIKDDRTQYGDVILINDRNEILFLVRNKNDEFEPGKYCLPGGHIEPEENAKAGAIRELAEETGIVIDFDKVQFAGNYVDNRINIHYFTAKYNGEPTVLEEKEQIQYEWVSLEDIARKPLLKNLKENLENIIELPKEQINPLEQKVGPLFYYGGLLIKSEVDQTLQKHLNTICECYNEDLLSKSDLIKSLLSISKNVCEYDIVKKGGELKHFAKLVKTGEETNTDQLEGVAFEKSLEDIAKKHGVDLSEIETQFKQGTEVEFEHTKKQDIAERIAKDHLWELPDYYTRLAEMEQEDKDLEKAKYLKRTGTPGDYKYVYEEPKDKQGKLISEKLDHKLGAVFEEFRNKPSEGIDKLISTKGGQVLSAFVVSLPVMGDLEKLVDTEIDIVWGRTDEEGRGEGLSHIIRKHIELQDDLESIEDLKTKLIDAIRTPSLKPLFDGKDIIFYGKDYQKVVVKRRSDSYRNSEGEVIQLDKHYILTSYDDTRGGKSKIRKTPIDTGVFEKDELSKSVVSTFGTPNSSSMVTNLRFDSGEASGQEGFSSPSGNPFSQDKCNNYISNDQILSEIKNQDGLEKANREAQVGEIREWSGQKMQKTPQGWAPVKKEGTKNQEDSEDSVQKYSEEQLKKYAKQSSTEDLQRVAEGEDKQLKFAAEKELQRRNGNSEGSKQVDSAESEVKPSKQKTLSEQEEFLRNRYQEVVTKMSNFSDWTNLEELNKLAREQKGISVYLQRIRSMPTDAAEQQVEWESLSQMTKIKNKEQLTTLLGDGEIESMMFEGDSKNYEIRAISQDCFSKRNFRVADKRVLMQEFLLNPEMEKAKGTGSKIFFNQVTEFKKAGFEGLETEASRSDVYNGYYSWAILGYEINPENQSQIEQFSKLTQQSDNEKIKSCKTLSELVSFKEGADYWKEEGFTFDGVFDMKDNSTSMKMLNSYVQRRHEKR
jgi:8-oxo-dGTP pyrophosphatase MutT (NUDIX family)